MTCPPHPPEHALPWRIPLLSGQQLDVETQSRAVCCSGFPLGTVSPRSLFSLDPFKTVLPRAAGGVKALCRDTDVTDEAWFSSKTKSFVLKPCWTTAVSPLACQLWAAENTEDPMAAGERGPVVETLPHISERGQACSNT